MDATAQLRLFHPAVVALPPALPPAAPVPPPAASRDTSFKACWAEYARAERLPADPDALMPRRTVAQHRRAMLQMFSCGLVHHERTRHELEEKLPLEVPARRRAGRGRGN